MDRKLTGIAEMLNFNVFFENIDRFENSFQN